MTPVYWRLPDVIVSSPPPTLVNRILLLTGRTLEQDHFTQGEPLAGGHPGEEGGEGEDRAAGKDRGRRTEDTYIIHADTWDSSAGLCGVFYCCRVTTAVVPRLHCGVSKCLITLFLLHLTCDSPFLKVTVTVWGWTTLLFTFPGEVNLSSWQEVGVGVVWWHGLLHHTGCALLCTRSGKTRKTHICTA